MSDVIEVQQVLARYVRATNRRDVSALASLSTANGEVLISHREDGIPLALGALTGRAAIAETVRSMMAPRRNSAHQNLKKLRFSG